MAGGTTNTSSNYNGSIQFSPTITDHGSIKNGNISTGNIGGSSTGSSAGGSGNLSYSGPIPMLVNLDSLQMLPFSCNVQVSVGCGPVKVSGGFTYSRLI